MTDVDSAEIEFQCPRCGIDLKQTIALLKAEKHMTCPACRIGINIDTHRLATPPKRFEGLSSTLRQRSPLNFSASAKLSTRSRPANPAKSRSGRVRRDGTDVGRRRSLKARVSSGSD
jgi:hypothetical protein